MRLARPPGPEQTSAELQRPEREQSIERVKRLPLVGDNSVEERINEWDM